MKKFLLFGMMAIMSMAAQAQIVSSNSSRITREKAPSQNYSRLYVGYANMAPAGDKEFTKGMETLQGLKAGYLHGISITSKLPLFVEFGAEIQYGTYGESESYEGIKVTSRENELAFNIPVSLAYKYTFKNGLYIEPYAGIRFRVNVLGNVSTKASYKGESESETFSYFDEDDMGDETFKRFQFGGQVGVNVGYKNLNFNLGYDMYTPIYTVGDYKFKYNTFTVGLGLNF